jgi:hypothetical protein
LRHSFVQTKEILSGPSVIIQHFSYAIAGVLFEILEMKTLQWTFVSWLLYAEAFLVALFLLPWIRARTWKRLLKSRFLLTISSKVGHYLWAILVGLLILFLGKYLRS